MTLLDSTMHFEVEPSLEAAHHAQATFRAILRAFSRPGEIVAAPPILHAPWPMSQSMLSAALCLLDGEVSSWLDPTLRTKAVEDFLRLRTGASFGCHPRDADFALIGDANNMPNLERFRAGTLLEPNRSTTLLIQLPDLVGGTPISLSGPGIKTEVSISPMGLPLGFWSNWDANAARFPVGVDVLLVDRKGFLGLPRSIRRSAPCS
ncbi:phosphonate C-P lyase system protein PhnH [Mesorhizobium dulcispinae]|uniref:phosphonate C-P lyase system protein PhnH n=1 Tax=Mesorhizobium dulcispinae TaxID=3072316 RepID=UPI002A242240|nr:phosphonate C-P lyase system protein PhnH [Mesorhizobium sp. VK23D]MDX8521769.1 phosphonate C-P lyase system protein PhnH [Mesorhizobium sp. VK23D]